MVSCGLELIMHPEGSRCAALLGINCAFLAAKHGLRTEPAVIPRALARQGGTVAGILWRRAGPPGRKAHNLNLITSFLCGVAGID